MWIGSTFNLYLPCSKNLAGYIYKKKVTCFLIAELKTASIASLKKSCHLFITLSDSDVDCIWKDEEGEIEGP